MNSAVKNRKPKLSRYLFWDTNLQKLDFEERAYFVLQRVFTMGMQEDEWKVIRFNGKERIRKEVIKCKSLDKKTMNYPSVFYNIPKEEIYYTGGGHTPITKELNFMYRAKDYVDIFFLLKEIPLKKKKAGRKYA